MSSIRLKRLFAWTAIGLVAASGAIFGGLGLRFLAVAILMVVGLRALEIAKTLTTGIRGWIVEAVGPAVLVLLCGIVYGRLLLGDLPVNHDHPVMLLRAWVTGSQLIPSGQLAGFSPILFAGHPANALYPMGTDLLVCFFKALGLGLISWETAYCWALFVAVVAYPTALYAVGHRLGGPMAGLVAGLLGVFDRGAWFQGGWDFNLFWGVWSMGLSFSLCLWTLWAFERLARLPGRPWLWLGAACALAGAVLCHPMAVAILGICLPLMLLVMSLNGHLPVPGLWLPRVVSGMLLGFGLCAFWLVPFIARQEWLQPLASAYRSFEEVLGGFLDGRLLNAFAPALAVAGLVGLGLGVRSRRPMALFLLSATGLLLFFSSDTFLLAFDALKKFPALAHLQPERFTYLVRAALLLGCGLLSAMLLRSASRPPTGTDGTKRHARRFLLALFLAPVLVIAPNVKSNSWFAPANPLTWSSQSKQYGDLRAAADHLNSLPREQLGRIALVSTEHDHLLMCLPVFTGLPVFKVGFTPENNYRYKFSSTDAEVFEVLGVSHVLSVGPRTRQEYEEIRRFGSLVLYRFKPHNPAIFKLHGTGQAVLVSDEGQALDIRLSGTGPDSRLIVYRARYALWQAELDGRPVAIDGASVGDSPPLFMAIEARDGLLSLRFDNGTAEWLGNMWTWLSLAIALLVALASRLRSLKTRLLARLAPLIAPVRDGSTLLALAGALLVVLTVGIKLLMPAPAPFEDQTVLADLTEHLPDARAALRSPGRTVPCQAWNGSRLQCPGPNWNYAGEVILAADYKLRQCIWLHPVAGAKMSVTFDDVPLGEHLQGHFGLDDGTAERRRPQDVFMTVLVDGQQVGRFTCPARHGWHKWQVATPGRSGSSGRVTIQSDAPNVSQRHFCFTAYSTQPSSL